MNPFNHESLMTSVDELDVFCCPKVAIKLKLKWRLTKPMFTLIWTAQYFVLKG